MKKLMTFLWPIILGVAIGFIVKTWLFTFVKVDGLSMYPTLQNNERVMEFKQAKIKRDRIVVFNAYGVDKNNPQVTKKTQYVKRVIGMPGDTIQYDNNGKLYVNGKFAPQTFITQEQRAAGTLDLQLPEAPGVRLGSGHKFKVPQGKYFVLGDNRKISNDSRYYGFVPRSKITGVVKVPIWNKNAPIINDYKDN